MSSYPPVPLPENYQHISFCHDGTTRMISRIENRHSQDQPSYFIVCAVCGKTITSFYLSPEWTSLGNWTATPFAIDDNTPEGRRIKGEDV